MIFLIPLGGLGVRFSQHGYKQPKALINVMGKPILYWLLDNLPLHPNTDSSSHLADKPIVYIPYNKAYAEYRFESTLRKQYPHIHFEFLCLKENTRGAAETIFLSLCHLETTIYSKDDSVLCLDGDNFYMCDIVSQWNEENCIFTFHDTQEVPMYSYVCVHPDSKNILNVVEKEKISNYACTGAYGFASWYQLKEKCQYILMHNIRQKGEFYTSTVIQEMLRDDVVFTHKQIERKDYICLGTPTQVRLFCHNYPRYNSLNNQCMIQPKRYCFDLDNTLVSFPTIVGDYRSVEPIQKNIEFLKYLKRFGHTIILYTARRMKTHRGNVGKILADIGPITFETLAKFDIPYDEIYFGKPDADVYIDDLALNCYEDLEKELGYYETMIKPRDFNSIRMETMQLCRKESDNLDGEIYYYQNIPPSVKDMFPIMVDYDPLNKWYSVEKVNGITASNLYLSQLLNTDQLKHIMNSIHRLHSVPIPVLNSHSDTKIHSLDITQNYIEKMDYRYKTYDYSRFPNHKETYTRIRKSLLEYKGICTVIHGDPVFTNILINDYGKIKYIDMRGKIGTTLTIYGDEMYDWAKLYQSLIGYDEILEDKTLNSAYKTQMCNSFLSYLRELYPNRMDTDFSMLKIITQCLLFSLIPLHDNEKCEQYYRLIDIL